MNNLTKKNLEEVDFDAVSGATYTKESFKELAEELLIKASKVKSTNPFIMMENTKLKLKKKIMVGYQR